MTPLKTRKQVRDELAAKGISFASVAKRYGFNQSLFYEILHDDDTAPRRKCIRGESHNIAVTMGIKSGDVSERQRAAA